MVKTHLFRLHGGFWGADHDITQAHTLISVESSGGEREHYDSVFTWISLFLLLSMIYVQSCINQYSFYWGQTQCRQTCFKITPHHWAPGGSWIFLKISREIPWCVRIELNTHTRYGSVTARTGEDKVFLPRYRTKGQSNFLFGSCEAFAYYGLV